MSLVVTLFLLPICILLFFENTGGFPSTACKQDSSILRRARLTGESWMHAATVKKIFFDLF
jgi:hypothetical protein